MQIHVLKYLVRQHITSNLIALKDCRCYVFSSLTKLSGTFKSPNYPYAYPAQMDCIIYLFQGRSDEIAQLQFWKFDISPPRLAT